MQLYFIRHAQSVNNHIYLQTGSGDGRLADPPLTSLGQQQVAYLADFLSQGNLDLPDIFEDQHNVRGFGFTHLYTSLMERAVQTAVVVAAKLNLPLIAWEEIHEVGGIWLPTGEDGAPVGLAGPNRAYFAERYPRLQLPDWLGKTGWWNRPYEAVEQRPRRAQLVVQQLLERHGQTDDRVAIVSHGGFYTNLMSALLNLPATSDTVPAAGQTWFSLANTAVSRIDFVDNGLRIVYLNRAEFLPREMVT
jgi:2,3-bisphosphoglycerate-dependent phosphoglycerate mutase